MQAAESGPAGGAHSHSVLIVAPHPDDETLGCAGVITKALRAGRRVRVVFATNGDGFTRAAAVLSGKDAAELEPEHFLAVARARQQGALDAARVLGLTPDDLVFLGYPDRGLARMPVAGARPFTQPFTGKNCTYGLAVPDYHTQTYGKPAPYVRSAALADLVGVIRSTEPAEIYVTDSSDGHVDHREWHHLVREAVADVGGKLFTYLIHSADGSWPNPRGANADMPFEARIVDGRRIPGGLPWPPPDRRPMSHEESALKLRAIHCYALEMQIARDYAESFVKSEEIFWHRDA